MILEKVIKQTSFQREYKPLVDAYIENVLAEFKDQIHSIYMCGSIPKGTATPFKSDADFTLVCENPAEFDYGKLSAIKDKLLEEYPFVTKIDSIICSIDNIWNRPNDWGFWIKVICVCVQGPDLGEQIPPVRISPAFIADLNTDTEQEFQRVRRSLSETDDPALRKQYIKGCSKKLMRALYSLILEKTGQWEDDMLTMKNDLLAYCEIDAALVEYLYACYLDSDVPVEQFLPVADEVYRDFEKALKAISANDKPRTNE